jgi:glycosyl-4,4'-diaponeurosporenoate acyltransferase
MDAVPRLLLRFVAGIACIAGLSVLIGMTAPRWPRRWLRRDAGPLHLTRMENRDRYERAGIGWLKRHYPELGSWFGGESKSRLPTLSDPASVDRYVVETRRAEWVHWLSCLTPLPVLLFAPMWLVAVLWAITLGINAIAIAIVRYNRLRLLGHVRAPRQSVEGLA